MLAPIFQVCALLTLARLGTFAAQPSLGFLGWQWWVQALPGESFLALEVVADLPRAVRGVSPALAAWVVPFFGVLGAGGVVLGFLFLAALTVATLSHLRQPLAGRLRGRYPFVGDARVASREAAVHDSLGGRGAVAPVAWRLAGVPAGLGAVSPQIVWGAYVLLHTPAQLQVGVAATSGLVRSWGFASGVTCRLGGLNAPAADFEGQLAGSTCGVRGLLLSLGGRHPTLLAQPAAREAGVAGLRFG
jgi:hypothetical protein